MKRRTLKSDRYFKQWPAPLPADEQMKLALKMAKLRARVEFLRSRKLACSHAQKMLLWAAVKNRQEATQAEYERVRGILWATNMRLVCWCCIKYGRRHTVVDELIGVGAEKMPYWIDHYDPYRINPSTGRPYSLSTYLAKCCWMACIRWLQAEQEEQDRVLRIGSSTDNNLGIWDKFITPLGDEYDEPGYSEEDLACASELIDELPDSERSILNVRLTTDMTLDQIAQASGFSRERARKLERQGLDRIARAIGEEKAAGGIYQVEGRRRGKAFEKKQQRQRERQAVRGNHGCGCDQASAS